MAQKQQRGLLVANKTFLIEHNVWVRAGDTVVAGHPILRGRAEAFRPFTPTFDLPDPVAEPEPAPAAPAPDETPA